jgi:hypothetical protein
VGAIPFVEVRRLLGILIENWAHQLLHILFRLAEASRGATAILILLIFVGILNPRNQLGMELLGVFHSLLNLLLLIRHAGN